MSGSAATRPRRRWAFDLDGTLIDARGRQVGVAAEALREVAGIDLAESQFWRRKRSGATTMKALVGLGVAADIASAAARRWAERIESDEWLDRDRRLPGVLRVLRDLNESGSWVSVVTARRRAEGAARSIAVAGIEALVSELVVVDPKRAAEEKAAVLSRAEGFVGDTESDGRAAALAGVPFIAVSTGQRSARYLRERGLVVAGSLHEAMEGLAG